MNEYRKGIAHALIGVFIATSFTAGAAVVTLNTNPVKDYVMKYYLQGINCSDKHYPDVYCRTGMDGIPSAFGRSCFRISPQLHDRFRTWLGTMYPVDGGEPQLGGPLNEWWPALVWIQFMNKFAGSDGTLNAGDKAICNEATS